MRILESERIILKPVEPEDLPFLLELRWNAALVNHIIHDPIYIESQNQWLARVRQKGDLAMSIFYKDEKAGLPTIVGTTGLYDFDRRHQRAVWKSLRLQSEYQGKGIALEASKMLIDYGFNTLNLHKITSDSFADNHAILKLLESLGFQKEGVLRKHYFHNGAFKDALIHGLLREEFKGKIEEK